MSILDFERERDAIIRAIDRASESAIREALTTLNILRQRILEQMRSIDTSFNIYRMRRLQDMIEADIFHVERSLAENLVTELEAGFARGIELVNTPLRGLGITSTPAISNEVLVVAQNISADLIQGLTNEIRAKVNQILRRAVLGSLTFQDALNEIGRSLDSRGAFQSIAARAETILRTEILRIHSQATQLQMEAQSKAVSMSGYEIMKGWLATHDLRVRPAHLAAEAVYMADAIPVDEPFIVDGEELMFPGDPDGSPENTINCRCASTPVVKRISKPINRPINLPLAA